MPLFESWVFPLRSRVTSEKLLNLSEPYSKNWNNNATTSSFLKYSNK